MNKRIPNIVVILIAPAMGGNTVRSATINWTDPANAGMRRKFDLPLDRPLNP
jgi:hypothetical protein